MVTYCMTISMGSIWLRKYNGAVLSAEVDKRLKWIFIEDDVANFIIKTFDVESMIIEKYNLEYWNLQ